MKPRLLVTVWAGLIVLLALTYGLAHVDLGPFNLPVALAIGGAKAWLVLHFFMELRDRSRLVNLFAGTGFFVLAVLIVLGLSDYLGRGLVR